MTTTSLAECIKNGVEYRLYYNTGTCDVPVWVEHIGIIGDISISEQDDESELPLRDPSILIKQFTAGKTDLSVSGQQTPDFQYEGHNFMNAMRFGGAPADIAILSDDMGVVGATGWRGKWWNIDRGQEAPQSGNATQTFNLRPAVCTDCPVRPVQVSVADDVSDYDPTTFTPAV